MGQDRVESWDVWYPKARAAYQELTPDTPDDKVLKIYKDVTLVPPYTTYAMETIGNLDASNARGEQQFYIECVRLFKAEFGDSDSYLAVLQEKEPPVFFVGMSSLDGKDFTVIIYSIANSQLGQTVTFQRSAVCVNVERRSFFSQGIDYFLGLFTCGTILYLPLLPFMAIGWPWITFQTICKQILGNAKSSGWGLSANPMKSIVEAHRSASAEGVQFVSRAEAMISRIFAGALNRQTHTRGAHCQPSQLPGQGMPPSSND